MPRVAYAVLFGILVMMSTADRVSAQQGGAAPVTVARPLEAQVVDWAEFTGRFEAQARVDVRARVSGYLNAIHFEDGQHVEAGDPLFDIDPGPYEAVVAQARADVERARAQANVARLDYERGEELLPEGAITAGAVDQRRATFQSAQADLLAAQAALESAQLDLGYTKITAPISGRISSARVDEGNLVSSAQATVLTSIVKDDPIRLVFDVSETAFLRFDWLQGSASVTVQAKLLDEDSFTRDGVLDFIDNAFDRDTGTIRMRAVFDNPDGRLVPGLFASLRMPASRPYSALLVPDRAVVSDQDNKLLMTVGEDGTVVPKPVVLGAMHQGLRIVRSGIEPGDRVIIDGLLAARPGAPVTPEETTIETTGQD